jgi:hypothetical protein
MERHFGVIPDIPFRGSLLRYAEAKKRENPKGFNASRRFQLQLLLDNFGKLMLNEINAKTIRDFADMRRKTVSDSTLHRDLAVLRAILNKGRGGPHRPSRIPQSETPQGPHPMADSGRRAPPVERGT